MSAPEITVHMIGQAHLDPVWLWGWPAGLDEVLATCRTACDLLDVYPEFVFTRAEAWSYQQVERVDPALFARIRAHVASGRWEIVGGWWLQPDCNFPGEVGLMRQIEVGKRYLLDRFGQFPTIGYNVDSFGHTAALPGLMHAAGQRHYVMMRPQEHEMALPARLFRWRGSVDGPEVVTFRIAGAYCSGGDGLWDGHISKAVSELPAGITDTMCFYGVGDHGGGPTADLIEWIKERHDAFPGCQLVFSSPSRFFAAIAGQVAALPMVTGELQLHAIGCYTVQREIKTGVRQAEHRLHQAELLDPTTDPLADDALRTAWERVSFAQFHDTLGGTCIPSAYPAVQAQLGAAMTVADERLQYGLRVKVCDLPDDPLQRIVLYNASDHPYDDYIEFEPWMQWAGWDPHWRLVNQEGRPVPFQVLPAEALCGNNPRLLFPIALPPGGMQVLKLERTASVPANSVKMAIGVASLSNALRIGIDLGPATSLMFHGLVTPLPRLALIEDLSDCWSHGLDRYPEGPVTSPVWHDPAVIHHGRLMSSLLQTGVIGRSDLRAEWRLYADRPWVELRLEVHWRERMKLLKLVYPMLGAPTQRRDGIQGGSLLRTNDGKERPLIDWTLSETDDAQRLGVVCPDVYAVDGAPSRWRFTLLRSAVMTHHEPRLGSAPHAVYADQGVHHFRFRFYSGAAATPDRLARDGMLLQRPLIIAETTKGMPRHQ